MMQDIIMGKNVLNDNNNGWGGIKYIQSDSEKLYLIPSKDR
jgi:hypothetical protein